MQRTDPGMSADEIIKHIPEIASAAKVAVAAVPFTAVVKRMLGPAADEVAEMWRDQIRLYRYERQLKCVEKAERMAKDAGFTPKAVPPKILFPLLEGASFEENEDLHRMWAALLANAASPERREELKPGLISILKQMSPDEAAFLNWIYDEHERQRHWPDYLEADALCGGFIMLGLASDREELRKIDSRSRQLFESSLDALQAAQLVRSVSSAELVLYGLTFRGREFVRACRPPEPKP
jgi:hypothetical protein